jgi:DNA polymerase-1
MKLKTTYVDTLPNQVDNKKRVHTTYHQLGTTTGRLSSSDPNLQNIPIRGEWGQEIRKAFVAEKGYKLLSADYSQIELRVAACLAKDKKMIEAFKENQDIHKITAAEVNNIPLAKVTPEMRYQAKALNFGVLYGMSVNGFAEAAGISWERARDFIDEYMADFSGIAKYIGDTKEKAKTRGYVETILGRRRYLPQIDSSDFRIRQAFERMAINMPIQGTAADIMKVAMVKLAKSLPSRARLLLQVHDELVLEVKEYKIKQVAKIVKDVMENVLEEPIFKEVKSIFNIPLKVDVKIGDNWGEM